MDGYRVNQHIWLRHVVSILIVFAALVVRVVFLGALGTNAPFITFYPAVMFAALYGGLSSGVLATALGALLASYWMEPFGRFGIERQLDWLAMFVFIMSGAMMSCVSEAMRRARIRAGKAEFHARIAADREKAVVALRESEELFRATFEQTAIGMAQTALDGRFLRVNAKLCEMLGYSRDELVTLSLQDLVYPEDLAAERILILRLIEGEIPSYSLARRCVRKNGAIIWTEVTASLARRPSGKPDYIIHAKIDITGRKQTEDALRENEKSLALAQALTHVGNWSWNIEDNKVVWSDETYKIFGVEKDRFTPSLEANARMFHPDDLERQQEWLNRSLVQESLEPLELRIIRPSGELRHLLALAECIVSADAAKPQQIFGTVLDITDRKKLELELRKAKEMAERRADEVANALRLLSFHLDNAPIAILERDPELRIIRWSKGAERAFGWKTEEVEGKTSLEIGLVFEEDLPEVSERFRRLQDGLEIRQSGYNRNRRKDGAIICCDWHNSVLRNDQGQIISFLSIAQDMTWRVKAEEKLKAAKEEAENANQAKSEFLANMSHEIRTPMNGIIGMTELALMACQDSKAKEYLQMARQSGQALLAIVNDILDLSKVEAGQAVLVRAPFRLRKTIEELAKSLEVSAQAKGLALLHSIDPETPDLLLGDKGRLGQVLTNIIGNGIKFTEKGTVALFVSLEEEPVASTATLCFSVSDTGIGIPQDKLASIFESFTQVGGSAHVKYGGTGLGLSITKALVELMGGRLEVKSQEGMGSTFFFTVRFDLATEEQAQEEAAPPQKIRDRPKLKVLLAEDNLVNQVLATELLQRGGHEVETVENGQEALEKLKQEAFDVVLMDIRMPVMGGEEAARRIRGGEAGDPAIPIVALTAHALKGDRDRFLLAGMDGYLAKPISSEELDQTLENVMAARMNGARGANPPKHLLHE